MPGRPTVLTPEVLDRLGELRREGYSVSACVRELGLSRSTVLRGLARLRPVEPPEPWWEQANAEPALVGAILRGAQVDWRAAAWVLERRWPERWAHPSHRRPGDDKPPLPVGPDPFSEVDELAERRRRPR